MSVKVKIKFLANINQDEFSLMKTINSVVPLNIIDCYKGHSHVTIHLMSHKDLEKLITQEATEKFLEVNLHVVQSPKKVLSHFSLHFGHYRRFMLRSCLQRVPSNDDVRNIMKSVTKLFWATVRSINYENYIEM